MSDTSYENFVRSSPGTLERLENIRNNLNSLMQQSEDISDVQDTSEIIKILEQDPRISRISANGDILEIYTVPIIFNINECDLPYYVEDEVDSRHEKLNFGQYVILIKPGFMPYAFPYDVTEYNVPPMYRYYRSESFLDISYITNFEVYSECFRLQICGMRSYAWILSNVGKQLGCYEIKQENEDYIKYNILTPHPHVSGEGCICYGNIKDMMYDAISINALNFIVNITLDVLFTYNDENPYFQMWRKEPCSLCPDRYTYTCGDCQCDSCHDRECNECENFRQASLYKLFKIRRGLLKLYVYDASIPRKERIEEMKKQVQTLLQLAIENNPDLSESDLVYYLKENDVDCILNDDYDDLG